MTQSLKKLGRNISILLTVGIALLILPQLTGSAASTHFFYFNPDSAHSNLSGLKQTVDTFLSTGGFSFSFQPFTRFQDFNRQVKEDHPSLLFLPDWYLKQDGNDKTYKPFLIPVRQGATTYRKVLLVGANSGLTTTTLGNATIAMTPLGPAGMTKLNEALFKNNGLSSDKINVITTAKDADALFALVLGQVKAAVISQDTLERIGKLNPNIDKTVKVLAISAALPLPILCYAKDAAHPEELDKLRKTLLAGKTDTRIAQFMELLDIDAWQEPAS